MKLLHVVGARPNFPKLAPVWRAARNDGIDQVVVHTGQHYDDAMSAAFFRDLGMPEPNVNLDVGSGTHAAQTARVMERLEPVVVAEAPDWVVVYGDVNSTVAAALVAAKLHRRVAHVEAGLRSHDRTMPEEINRIVTDRLSDLLLTPTRSADATLRAEGEPEREIAFVGNVMVDALLYAVERARLTQFRRQVGAGAAAVAVTLHRPSNVDDPVRLSEIVRALRAVAEERPVVFPVHPRTRARLEAARLELELGAIQLLPPLGYLEMLDLIDGSHAVITDSGGVQVEATALGVPCLTVRDTTEWPETVECGANQLVYDPRRIAAAVRQVHRLVPPPRPEGWDGMAAVRVVDCLRLAL